MTTQPEALRLADFLEHPLNDANHVAEDAAAELRRLHQFAEEQMTKATHALKVAALERQRDALLEALRNYVDGAACRWTHT